MRAKTLCRSENFQMSNVRKKAEALRDECERLARHHEKIALRSGLSPEQKLEEEVLARVYWQMSRWHADTVVHASDARPRSFTAKNKGKQCKTAARNEFLMRLSGEIQSTKHEAVASAACERKEAHRLWALSGRRIPKQELEKKVRNHLKNHKPFP